MARNLDFVAESSKLPPPLRLPAVCLETLGQAASGSRHMVGESCSAPPLPNFRACRLHQYPERLCRDSTHCSPATNHARVDYFGLWEGLQVSDESTPRYRLRNNPLISKTLLTWPVEGTSERIRNYRYMMRNRSA